jgi:hypothetical protein
MVMEALGPDDFRLHAEAGFGLLHAPEVQPDARPRVLRRQADGHDPFHAVRPHPGHSVGDERAPVAHPEIDGNRTAQLGEFFLESLRLLTRPGRQRRAAADGLIATPQFLGAIRAAPDGPRAPIQVRRQIFQPFGRAVRQQQDRLLHSLNSRT